MIATFITNGFLCALMLLCAASVRGADRRLAFELAAVLFGVWLIYVSTWFEATSPALMLGIQPEEVWAATDCAAGMWIVFRSGGTLWGCALFGLTMAMGAMHFSAHQRWVDFDPYKSVLDVLFWGQVAVFLLLGGRGALQRVARLTHHGRNDIHSHRSTVRQARPR